MRPLGGERMPYPRARSGACEVDVGVLVGRAVPPFCRVSVKQIYRRVNGRRESRSMHGGPLGERFPLGGREFIWNELYGIFDRIDIGQIVLIL